MDRGLQDAGGSAAFAHGDSSIAKRTEQCSFASRVLPGPREFEGLFKNDRTLLVPPIGLLRFGLTQQRSDTSIGISRSGRDLLRTLKLAQCPADLPVAQRRGGRCEDRSSLAFGRVAFRIRGGGSRLGS